MNRLLSRAANAPVSVRSDALRSSLTFLLLAGERFFQMAVGVLVMSSVARSQGTEGFALWQIAYSMWVVAQQVSGVAGERVMLPRLCQLHPGGLQSQLDSMRQTKLIAAVLGAVVLVLWAGANGNAQVVSLALAWAVYVLLAEPLTLGAHWCYAKDDFITPQLARISGLAVRVLIVLVVIWLDAPMIWLIVSWIVEVCIFGLIVERKLPVRPRLFAWPPDWPTIRSMLQQGGALAFVAAVAAALPRTDRLFAAAHIEPSTIAHYSAAMSLLEALIGVAAVLSTILGARYLFRPGPIALLAHLAMILAALVVSLMMVAGLQALDTWLIVTIFGESFRAAVPYLQVAVWLLPIVFVQVIAQTPLISRASEKYMIVKALCALSAGVLVTWLIISQHHYEWLAAGAFAGFIVFLAFDVAWLIHHRHDVYGIRNTTNAPT